MTPETPEQIAEHVAAMRVLSEVSMASSAERTAVALADLVERHLEAIRAVYAQQRRGHEPDVESLQRLDATEIALSKAVRR